MTSINPEDTPRLGYPVDVVWPGNHRRGMLQYPPEGGSSFECPILVIDGRAYGALKAIRCWWSGAKTAPGPFGS